MSTSFYTLLLRLAGGSALASCRQLSTLGCAARCASRASRASLSARCAWKRCREAESRRLQVADSRERAEMYDVYHRRCVCYSMVICDVWMSYLYNIMIFVHVRCMQWRRLDHVIGAEKPTCEAQVENVGQRKSATPWKTQLRERIR